MDQLNEIDCEDHKIISFKFLSAFQKKEILKWRNNSNIRKWMFNDKLISTEEHNLFLQNLNTNNKNFYWLVEDIGVIYLNKVDLNNRNAFLGIYKNPGSDVSGRVLINCLIKIAFKNLNLHTLKLEVLEDNLIAINFYKKIGFIEEGILKDFVFRNDKWLNVLIMGLINHE